MNYHRMVDTTHTHIGDCLDILRLFDDQVINLTMTSPPFADARKKTYGGIHPDDYVEWFLPRSAEIMRVLRPGGSFVLNIKERCHRGERHTYVYDLVIALKKQGWLWTEEYIWCKQNCSPGKWPNRFRDAWEHCYHFTKQRNFRMYQEAVMVPVGEWAEPRLKKLSANDRIRYSNATGSGFARDISAWVGRDMVYPDNVLRLPTVGRNTGHSAAYPEALPRFFIKLFTKPADLVLDPFSGSGTTLRAAHKLGRYSLGIDLVKPSR